MKMATTLKFTEPTDEKSLTRRELIGENLDLEFSENYRLESGKVIYEMTFPNADEAVAAKMTL